MSVRRFFWKTWDASLSKEWFQYARTSFLKDLQLSANNLKRMMSSSEREETLAAITDCSKALSLEWRGFEDWNSFSESMRIPGQHT